MVLEVFFLLSDVMTAFATPFRRFAAHIWLRNRNEETSKTPGYLEAPDPFTNTGG